MKAVTKEPSKSMDTMKPGKRTFYAVPIGPHAIRGRLLAASEAPPC